MLVRKVTIFNTQIAIILCQLLDICIKSVFLTVQFRARELANFMVKTARIFNSSALEGHYSLN